MEIVYLGSGTSILDGFEVLDIQSAGTEAPGKLTIKDRTVNKQKARNLISREFV
jgi:hypothetical protein